MTSRRTQLTGQIQRPGALPENARAVLEAVTPYYLPAYRVPFIEPEIASGAITFDYQVTNVFNVTLDANITSITISNAPPNDFGEMLIRFVQDGTGSRTVSGWPSSVKWPGGTAPTITTTATTGVDLIALKTFDAGTTWYGDYSQDYS